MPEDNTSSDNVPQIHQVNIAIEGEDPSAILIKTVAELKGVDLTDLSPLYSCINHLVDHMFETPPPVEADAVLTFSYEGFRITLYQDGLAVIRPHH